ASLAPGLRCGLASIAPFIRAKQHRAVSPVCFSTTDIMAISPNRTSGEFRLVLTITLHWPTYRYKPVPVSALAIYHSSRKSLENQLQRSLARQAGGASRTGSRGNPHSSGT